MLHEVVLVLDDAHYLLLQGGVARGDHVLGDLTLRNISGRDSVDGLAVVDAVHSFDQIVHAVLAVDR